MKSPAAYYFLLLYLTVIAKPLLPLAADWWAHTFDEARHMALVHARYGPNHLQKELAEAGSSKENSKSQNTLKTEDIVCFHVSPGVCTFDFLLHNLRIQHLRLERSQLAFVYRRIQLPPPKSC